MTTTWKFTFIERLPPVNPSTFRYSIVGSTPYRAAKSVFRLCCMALLDVKPEGTWNVTVKRYEVGRLPTKVELPVLDPFWHASHLASTVETEYVAFVELEKLVIATLAVTLPRVPPFFVDDFTSTFHSPSNKFIVTVAFGVKLVRSENTWSDVNQQRFSEADCRQMLYVVPAFSGARVNSPSS